MAGVGGPFSWTVCAPLIWLCNLGGREGSRDIRSSDTTMAERQRLTRDLTPVHVQDISGVIESVTKQ